MPNYLEVPSDISILESRYSNGTRKLTFFENLGLMGMPPMLHLRRTRNDKHDYRRILSNLYNSTPSDEVEEILITRQNSIRKKVLSHNMLWGGVLVSGLGSWYSIRFYDYKSKLIVIPFVMYGGSWVGRWFGDLITGRVKEYKRDQFLGELPSTTYFNVTDKE